MGKSEPSYLSKAQRVEQRTSARKTGISCKLSIKGVIRRRPWKQLNIGNLSGTILRAGPGENNETAGNPKNGNVDIQRF